MYNEVLVLLDVMRILMYPWGMKAIRHFPFTTLPLCFAVVMGLSSCLVDDGYEEDDIIEEAEFLDEKLPDGLVHKAAEDCSVSISCAAGGTRSCSGTLGRCSASGVGFGSVSCTGGTTGGSCPDPDPNPSTCVSGSSCNSDADCGGASEGRCIDFNGGVCLCLK